MDVRPVDPRIVSFEDHHPTYHVYFWGPDLFCIEHELTQTTDVHEVLAWTEKHVPNGWQYGVHAIARCPHGEIGRYLLAGVDPA